jgi:integrase
MHKTPPRRGPNLAVRTREYLTKTEVDKLRSAAGQLGRHPHRDSTMILTAYRHALRAGELVDLRWEQVDWEQRVLHVRRLKRGIPSTHTILRDELAALRKVKGEPIRNGVIFRTESNGPLSERGFGLIVARAGAEAQLGFPAHPHMLRHACGYYLASQGHDTRAIQVWMGHRNIQHTVRYTELAPDRFKSFWKEGGEE